ncbi:MAG: Rrf2 family transcriptional regulator [bacterium]
MQKNSRFAVAVHVLAGLAIAKMRKNDECIPSERIAWSVNTNPVVIRRILGRLQAAGWVTTQSGASGGSKLIEDPKNITLKDVYTAIENRSLLQGNIHHPNEDCPVGSQILPTLDGVLSQVEQAAKQELQETTIAQIAKSIARHIN